MKSMNPSCKFLGFLIPTLILAFKNIPTLNLLVFAICMITIALSGVNLKKFLCLMMPVLICAIGLFFTGYRFHNTEHFETILKLKSSLPLFQEAAVWNGIVLSSRALAFSGMGILFVLTTDMIALIRSMQEQLKLPPVFAYGVLAAFGILPNMAREYKKARMAFLARGIFVTPFSPSLLKPLLIKSIRWSEALACAMESKGFTAGEKERVVYEPTMVRITDLLFPVFTTALIVLGFILL